MTDVTTRVLVVEVLPAGTLAQGRGFDEEGRAVVFVGEARPMAAIAEAIERSEDAWADVPDWAMHWRAAA